MNDDVRTRVGQALVHMVRRAEEAQERAARQHGLHPTDFRAIGYLHQAGQPVSPKDINAYLGLTSGSGTALLDRLEACSYIRRIPNPDDRRGALILLDREAASRPVQLFEDIQAAYYKATAEFTPQELGAIAAYLEHVAHLSVHLSDEMYGTVSESGDASEKAESQP